MKSYEDIFSSRGSQYDNAMRRYPNAREEEFRQILSSAELEGTETVADVPAGGGYLQAYLPATCRWLGHEPCSGFHGHGVDDRSSGSLLPLPWEDDCIDLVLSLAGVHHISDKRPLFREARRVTKPGGRFVLSDVAADSAVAHFLDDYVGRFNTTGHEGVYLDGDTDEELSAAGWHVKESAVSMFTWNFNSREDMEAFCNDLFGLRRVPTGQTAKVIEEVLSVDKRPGGGVGMEWSLKTIVCDKVV